MAEAAERETRMTLEAYRAWRERQPERARYELIGGVVVRMMNGRHAHQVATFAIASQLRAQLPPGGACRVYIDGMAVQIDEDSEFEPDVYIHCHPNQRGPNAAYLSSPSVVIEVLSPSTRAADLLRKTPRYLRIDGLGALVAVNVEPGAQGAFVYDPAEPSDAPIEHGRDAVLRFALPGGLEATLDLGAVFDELDAA